MGVNSGERLGRVERGNEMPLWSCFNLAASSSTSFYQLQPSRLLALSRAFDATMTPLIPAIENWERSVVAPRFAPPDCEFPAWPQLPSLLLLITSSSTDARPSHDVRCSIAKSQ
jgi:hypothetical protein